MLILSWNLLWHGGAGLDDICRLIGMHRPDLVLLQEAPAEIDAMPDAVGGTYVRRPMPGRRHGLAAWSLRPFTAAVAALPLATRLDVPVPVWRLLGPRLALIVRLDGSEFANVHLDHGQFANRRQIRQLFHSHPQLKAVIGDFNAVGVTSLPGFLDVGPRQVTHRAYGFVPFRLDRCLVRGFYCVRTAALPYGPSDHRPILVELDPTPGNSLTPGRRQQRRQ